MSQATNGVLRHPAPTTEAPPWRAVISASIGNALEWFDLVVYGFFAATISKLFFPTGDDTVSLMLTLGTFGVSFFLRPLGAIVIGAYADRAGRKAALTLSIVLMFTGTLMISIVPTYSSIGLFAPAVLVVARMIQGFSAGGEFGSATAFLAEHAPKRRGFFSSWQVASQGLTTLLAAGFGAVLTTTLTGDQMAAWGWRIPFIFGLLIGPVAYYIRRNVDESPEFAKIEATIPKPNAPYRGTQSIALAGGKTMDNKMVYIGGTMYMQIAGSTTWLGTPVGDLKVLAAETAKLTSNCKAGATELVGSTPTRVWTSQIKSPIDGALSEQKLWIGVNDGRVYRQKTADLDQRLFYDNVVAPVIAGK